MAYGSATDDTQVKCSYSDTREGMELNNDSILYASSLILHLFCLYFLYEI